MSEYKRRLRSSVDPKEKEEIEKKLKLEKEAFENRPFINYKGKLVYHTTFMDCAMICDTLLLNAQNSEDQYVVGFDLEWPFSFQTGPGKTAVMQISPTLDLCYIFHISELKKLPKSLSEFLQHPNVKLTGVNIKNDARKLARDFAGFDSDKLVENCLDLGVLANSILPVTQRWSMEKLVSYVLQMKINKDKKVRMSKWHIVPLSKAQQVYAAIDAYASLLLYMKLQEQAQRQAMEENAGVLKEIENLM